MKTTANQKLNKGDRPDYRLIEKGLFSLSDAEIISIVTQSNTTDEDIKASRDVLTSIDNNLSNLAKLSYTDYRKLGMTHSKACSLVASFELGRRRRVSEMPNGTQIKCSKDIHNLLSPYLEDLPHEEFWVVYLNRSNKVIGKMKLSQGGISGTVTDIRVILKKALEYLASGMIVCHNHPSGNMQPSESDTKITQKIKEAGSLLDVQLLDHIIIGNQEFYSFADSGLL